MAIVGRVLLWVLYLLLGLVALVLAVLLVVLLLPIHVQLHYGHDGPRVGLRVLFYRRQLWPLQQREPWIVTRWCRWLLGRLKRLRAVRLLARSRLVSRLRQLSRRRRLRWGQLRLRRPAWLHWPARRRADGPATPSVGADVSPSADVLSSVDIPPSVGVSPPAGENGPSAPHTVEENTAPPSVGADGSSPATAQGTTPSSVTAPPGASAAEWLQQAVEDACNAPPRPVEEATVPRPVEDAASRPVETAAPVEAKTPLAAARDVNGSTAFDSNEGKKSDIAPAAQKIDEKAAPDAASADRQADASAAKAAKPPKADRKKPPKGAGPGEEAGELRALLEHLPAVVSAAGRFVGAVLHALRWRRLRVIVPVSGGPPDRVARRVGGANAWFYAIAAGLEPRLRLQWDEVRIFADYDGSQKDKLCLEVCVSGQLLPMAIAALYLYIALKKENIF